MLVPHVTDSQTMCTIVGTNAGASPISSHNRARKRMHENWPMGGRLSKNVDASPVRYFMSREKVVDE